MASNYSYPTLIDGDNNSVINLCRDRSGEIMLDHNIPTMFVYFL